MDAHERERLTDLKESTVQTTTTGLTERTEFTSKGARGGWALRLVSACGYQLLPP